jgi:hypothetical protein
MVYEIRRINIWSVMKIAFVIFAILGLIIGIFYFIFFLFMGQVMEMATPGEFGGMTGAFGGLLGFFGIFFLAIFYAVFGSLMTALFAGIYNLMARGFGGIEVHLEARDPGVEPARSSSPAVPPVGSGPRHGSGPTIDPPPAAAPGSPPPTIPPEME